ncbi:hypothetical protein HA402_010572 [Bradysia odoriphaga]|nr:hypothetical protein HA402_010572 [Bradysia odoriphaga]
MKKKYSSWVRESLYSHRKLESSNIISREEEEVKKSYSVVERELNVPLPLSKIIKKWNNLLQEYKAIKLSEEPKRREWPFFNLMDVYFSDQVNDPTLRLFSSTKTLGSDSFDYNIKLEDDPVMSSAIAAATAGSLMDISDMMQDAQSDKASENNFDDSKSDVPVNNNNNSNAHNNYNHVNRHRDYEEKMESSKPQPHTPSYMPQHHNIDQYLLSWNNFHGNMCKGFHNLQKDEKMVDVTIAAGGKIFKAHKLVLSVCSPYFQKIFLEHPSTHPILFMADVNSSHMAGLLDFMYSGQVNVKYEDLPKFLKVAESMQIKGLHTESTTEIDDSKVSPPPQRKEPKPMNHLNQHDTNIPILNLAREKSFREHIRSKLSPHDILNNNNNNTNNNNISYNNNNNNNNNNNTNNNNINSSTNSNNNSTNNNNNNNNNNIPSNYVIHQTNSSSKILDNQKYHKYFSKRKMIAQYEHEMQNDKKNRLNSDENNQSDGAVTPNIHTSSNNNGSNAIKADTDNDCEPNESQSIKVEPDIMVNQDDDSNGGDYYMADLSKRKHSQLERISLKPQSDTNTRNLSAICS